MYGLIILQILIPNWLYFSPESVPFCPFCFENSLIKSKSKINKEIEQKHRFPVLGMSSTIWSGGTIHHQENNDISPVLGTLYEFMLNVLSSFVTTWPFFFQVAACELLHSLVLYMLGRAVTQPEGGKKASSQNNSLKIAE